MATRAERIMTENTLSQMGITKKRGKYNYKGQSFKSIVEAYRFAKKDQAKLTEGLTGKKTGTLPKPFYEMPQQKEIKIPDISEKFKSGPLDRPFYEIPGVQKPVNTPTTGTLPKPFYEMPQQKEIKIPDISEKFKSGPLDKPFYEIPGVQKPVNTSTTGTLPKPFYEIPPQKEIKIPDISEKFKSGPLDRPFYEVPGVQKPVNPDPVQPEGNKKVKPSRQERLKKIRNNPEARARYNNLKLRNNPELKARYDSMKAFKKAGKWKKAGKIGAIIAGAAALIGGAIALFGGKDKKADGAGAVPVVPQTDETQQPAEPAAPVTEPAPADETPAQPTAPVESQEPAALEEKEIEAVIGDNYWKYAKQELIAEHQGEADYKPTDKEILKRTFEIMDRNGVKLAEDGIHSDPILKVGDKVKIKVAA